MHVILSVRCDCGLMLSLFVRKSEVWRVQSVYGFLHEIDCMSLADELNDVKMSVLHSSANKKSSSIPYRSVVREKLIFVLPS